MTKEKRDLLVFGYGLVIIAMIFAIGGWHKHGLNPAVMVLLLCSLVFGVVTTADYKALKPGYRGWMKVAHLIGAVVTTLVLGIVFIFIFTPIGIFLRLIGRDYLQRDFSKSAISYWEKRPKAAFQKEQYHQQF